MNASFEKNRLRKILQNHKVDLTNGFATYCGFYKISLKVIVAIYKCRRKFLLNYKPRSSALRRHKGDIKTT
jgi:hypothetical protein